MVVRTIRWVQTITGRCSSNGASRYKPTPLLLKALLDPGDLNDNGSQFEAQIRNMIVPIILTTILLAVITWWASDKFIGGPLPPGPKGIPIFGNLLSLMWASLKGEAPFVTLEKWGHQYGSLCYLRFATQRVVIVSDAQIAQQMCVKQAENFSERPPGLFVARVLKGTGTRHYC